ncbi:MAG: Brp/Blh family beta-carotene 15,15'-dioxygenase [Alphaproteobacteria bacterium]|nr:Brp/Blh family beta-carotene 15,15'-dioxygenase [Alphaproteobacteria bacterium]
MAASRPLRPESVPTFGPARTVADCRAPQGRGNSAPVVFWPVAVALLLAIGLGAPLGQSAAVLAATVLFVGGGLPHGAYDIALLRRAIGPDRRVLALAVGGYVAIATAMALLWRVEPLIALVLFLVISAVHFGEDWQMLEEPLLRLAAGAAVIAAATIGHPTEVAALFVAMSDARGALVARLVMAAAPVVLALAGVGLVVAWQAGSRAWAAAMTLCLMVLLTAPPVLGFALFFVFLHSPLHLGQARAVLSDMPRWRWVATGALLSGAAILGWLAIRFVAPLKIDATFTAQAFQLLAAVAAPHLILSHWLERRLAVPVLAKPLLPWRVKAAPARAGVG